MNNDFNNSFQNPTPVNEPAAATEQVSNIYRWDASLTAEAQPQSKKLGGVAIFGIVLAVAYAVAGVILAVVLAVT